MGMVKPVERSSRAGSALMIRPDQSVFFEIAESVICLFSSFLSVSISLFGFVSKEGRPNRQTRQNFIDTLNPRMTSSRLEEIHVPIHEDVRLSGHCSIWSETAHRRSHCVARSHRGEDHARAAKLLQFSRGILRPAVDVNVRAELAREL